MAKIQNKLSIMKKTYWIYKQLKIKHDLKSKLSITIGINHTIFKLYIKFRFTEITNILGYSYRELYEICSFLT